MFLSLFISSPYVYLMIFLINFVKPYAMSLHRYNRPEVVVVLMCVSFNMIGFFEKIEITQIVAITWHT